VIKQPLEEVGFVIDLQVFNRATLVQRRNNPELWDASTVSFPTYLPDPTLYGGIRCDGWGRNCDQDHEKLLYAMATDWARIAT